MMETSTLLSTIKDFVGNEMEVTVQSVQRGNVDLTGISIGNESIRPIVYMESYEDLFHEQGYEAVAKDMVETCRKAIHEANKRNIDIDKIQTWDYAKEHLALCIKPARDNNDFITIPYLDLELYFRVHATLDGTYKVTQKFLDIWNITKEELLEAAFNAAEYTVASMRDLLMEMMGDCEELMDSPDMKQTVISNKDKLFGASALFHKEILKNIAEQYKSDLYIIPSSIHELIVLPTDAITVKEMNQMIEEVNETQVAPEDRLSDHVYIFHKDTMEIDW